MSGIVKGGFRIWAWILVVFTFPISLIAVFLWSDFFFGD